MQGLISWVMRSRIQAIAGTVIAAVLGLMLTPLSIVSASIVVLATLRNGPKEGLLVALSGALVFTLLGGLALQMPGFFGFFGLMLLLPAWMLASWLGASGSLSRAIEAAAVGGLLIVLAQYLLLGDPSVFWLRLLEEYVKGQFDPALMTEDQMRQALSMTAAWMPGGAAAAWMIGMTLALFLGLWAQAVLENSGAFGEAFRRLQFSRTWLIGVAILLALSFFVYRGEASLVGQFYLVGMTLFLLQGISLAHALVDSWGQQKGWLFGLYFFLVVAAPYSFTALAAAGYADGWFNFRAKARAASDKPPGSQE